VEAVVFMPVLIIILASVYFVRNQVLARQAAEAKARTCAWAYSMQNCDDIPVGCEGFVHETRDGGAVAQKITDALSRSTGGIIGPIISGVLKPALKAAFGRSLEANTQVSFVRPGVYGGSTQNAQGRYQLACNLKRETAPDVAKDAWNVFTH